MSSPLLIAFGANIDPLNNIYQGLNLLHKAITIKAISTIWRTEPLPDPNQQENIDLGGCYLNGAVLSYSCSDPFTLKKILEKIESDCRRVRTDNPYAPRSLDLDIAMLGSQIVNSPELTLPDPDIAHRPFVALPLAQLLPDMIHPLANRTLANLAADFLPLDENMVADSEATNLLQSLLE